jgi:hypothetical protein
MTDTLATLNGATLVPLLIVWAVLFVLTMTEDGSDV